MERMRCVFASILLTSHCKMPETSLKEQMKSRKTTTFNLRNEIMISKI